MKSGYLLMLLFGFSFLFITACSTEDSTLNKDVDTAVITDRTGRQWDVTYTRDNYDLNPGFYNYGLGLGAIDSVDDPEVITDGEPGYPSPDSRITVFGVNHNDEQRAYTVSALTRHEVFNDVFPGESKQYLAVTF